MKRLVPLPAGLLVASLMLHGCSLPADVAERGVLPAEIGAGRTTAPGAGSGTTALAGGQRRGAGFEQLGAGGNAAVLRRSIGGQRTLPTVTGNRTVRLDYRDADAARVVREVVQDVLGLPVQLDASVAGRITLATPEPVPVTQVPQLLDEALRPLGLGIGSFGGRVRAGRIAELEAASTGTAEQRVIPLNSVAAADVLAAIRPSLPEGVRAQAEAGDRAISITGPSASLDTVQELVALFDTDALRGRSFGLYPLARAAPAAVARELELIFGGVRGITIAPIGRSNAVLVVADRPDLLIRARRVIAGLDSAPQGGATVQVVPVLHRRAAELADVVSRAFGAAPNPAAARTSPAGSFGGLSLGTGAGSTSGIAPRVPGAPEPDTAPGGPTLGGVSGLGNPGPADAAPGSQPLWSQIGLSAPVRIEADTGRNALLVIAAPSDAPVVLQAIRRLDQRQRQVFIEAVIAEVALNDQLRFGVNFSATVGDLGVSLLPVLANPLAGSFSLVLNNRNISGVVQALSSITDVRVVSAPRVLVLDNETATIQIGDQVPFLVQTQQSTQAPGAPLVSSVQLRDTGVIMAVRPRIGASGGVSLDLFQEVSDATQTTSSTIDSPTIQVRRLQTTINAQSGDTIALGGLMRDRSQRDRSGVPLLSQLPVLGALFGTREQAAARTELLLLLTPRVLDDSADLTAIVAELRARLGSLAPDLARTITPPPPISVAPRPAVRREPALDPLRESASPPPVR